MQLNNLTRWVQQISNVQWAWAFRRINLPVYDRMSSVMLNTPGLVIKAGGSPLAKTGGSDCYYVANGILNKIASATDMPALSGTVTNTQFGVFCFFGDSGGTRTSAFGGSFAALAGSNGVPIFPQFPMGKALIGFIIINPTGTGNFVGGTTALDDGTVTPNAVFVSANEGFDPWCLIGGQLGTE